MLLYHGQWFVCLYQELLKLEGRSSLIRLVCISLAAFYHACFYRMSRIHTDYDALSQTFVHAVRVCSSNVQHTTVPLSLPSTAPITTTYTRCISSISAFLNCCMLFVGNLKFKCTSAAFQLHGWRRTSSSG